MINRGLTDVKANITVETEVQSSVYKIARAILVYPQLLREREIDMSHHQVKNITIFNPSDNPVKV